MAIESLVERIAHTNDCMAGDQHTIGQISVVNVAGGLRGGGVGSREGRVWKVKRRGGIQCNGKGMDVKGNATARGVEGDTHCKPWNTPGM